MGKYLTEFSSNTAYNAALQTLDFPNVSLVENQLKYAESLPTMYRWVDDGDNTRCGDDREYDGCTLYQQTKKQKSVDGGQTWSDVVPAEYGYGDVIEEDSRECGCGGDPCDEEKWYWIDAPDYNSSSAVYKFKVDNNASGEWTDRDIFAFTVCSLCNNDGCPTLRFEIEFFDTTDYEEDPEAAPDWQIVLRVFNNCECDQGVCDHKIDERYLNSEGVDEVDIYSYLNGEEDGVDSLHIYDSMQNAPSGLGFLVADDCIDQC